MLKVWKAALVAGAFAWGTAAAQSGNGFFLEPVTSDFALSLPTGVAVVPGGGYYVAEKGGAVRVVEADGTVRAEPLVDLAGELMTDGDRGLTGIALHPDFPATPYLYLFYPVDDVPLPAPASQNRGYSRLVRYAVDVGGTAVVPGSRTVLLGATPETGPVSCYNSHSAGTVRFAHDGTLFLSHGDGASWAEPDAGGLYPECFDGTGLDPAEDLGAYRSQTTASLSGKILRVDPETGLGLPDNPFFDGDPASDASKVWALGLRNPFRFALAPVDPDNPDGPGQVVAGDVGQGAFEELNVAAGGENFGWPCFEGPRVAPNYDELPPPPGFACQTFEGTLTAARAYFHHFVEDASAPAGRTASSITGGAFNVSDAYPERFQGMLFFADYQDGWIAAGRVGPDGLEDSEQVLDGAGAIVDLVYDASGDVIVAVDIGRGRLVRLRNTGGGPAPPVARAAVSESVGAVVHAVTFSDDGSYDPAGGPLTYRWSFGTGDGADGPTVTYGYGVPGTYQATLSVTNEAGLTAAATVPVSVGLSLPELAILEPSSSVIPPSGAIELELTASDPRGEVLDTFWEVDLIHNAHTHPAFHALDAAQGSVLTVPHASAGEVSFYRARAVVIDEEGLRIERSVELVDTNPAEVNLGAVAGEPGATTVTLSHPLEIGRLDLTGVTAPLADGQVEVREGDAWVPARFVHTVDVDGVRAVLFASVATDGVRLVDAGAPATVELVARVPLDAALPDGWDPADAGTGVDGRTIPFGGGGLALVGAGEIAAGTFHTARRPLVGDGAVVARLDALDGGADAFAGVGVHAGLSDDGVSLTVGRTGDGGVVAWKRVGGVTSEVDLALDGAEWFRVRRAEGRLVAEVSSDSLAWTAGPSLVVGPDEPLVAGPVVAGAEQAAVAWFDRVDLLTGVVVPPPAGAFRVFDPFPNPGRGDARLVVEGGVPGTYAAEVVDARGRTLMTLPAELVGDEPRTFELVVPRDLLAPGVYYVRVRHAETGDTRLVQFVALR